MLQNQRSKTRVLPGNIYVEDEFWFKTEVLELYELADWRDTSPYLRRAVGNILIQLRKHGLPFVAVQAQPTQRNLSTHFERMSQYGFAAELAHMFLGPEELPQRVHNVFNDTLQKTSLDLGVDIHAPVIGEPFQIILGPPRNLKGQPLTLTPSSLKQT